MDATARTCGTAGLAGLALVAAGVIAVAPTAPPPGHHVSSAAVQLTDSGSGLFADFDLDDLKNIAVNFLHDLINIPYYEFKAIGLYADALGPPGAVGMDPDAAADMKFDVPYDALAPYNPNDPNPILAPIGVDHELVPVGVAGTGSWWMESIGNTWGWDEGNFAQVAGLANMLVPVPQFEQPFAAELQAFAMAEIVANPEACPFACPYVLDYWGRWFNVGLGKLFNGTVVGDEFKIGHSQDPILDDNGDPIPISPNGEPLSWAGETIRFDPLYPFQNFFESLMADPADNPIQIPTLQDIVDPLVRLVLNDINDFTPYLPGSVIYWGAPSFYFIPSFLAGTTSSLTGIDNPFAEFTPGPGEAFEQEAYSGNENPVGPLDLPGNLAAGFINLFNGYLGYLDPNTYLAAFDTDDHDIPVLSDWSSLLESGRDTLHDWADAITYPALENLFS